MNNIMDKHFDEWKESTESNKRITARGGDTNNDLDNDYDKIRKSLYDLTDQGGEAIELMMELARESEHPRAFEVLGQLIKQNAEISEKILKMHKTKKEIKKEDDKLSLPETGVTNNNVFIGSTAELQKLLHDENIIDQE